MSEPRALSTDQMAPDTLEALNGSIAKWEAIVAGTGVDKGVENCPLCKRFFFNCCQGCPVNDVGGYGCIGTPYDQWCALEVDKVTNDEEREYAQAELNFLKSLLPKEAV